MADAKPAIDYKKLTPMFLKGVFGAQMELIANHEKIKATLYEMMVSMAYHAPLARPCDIKVYPNARVIVQPTHWLVYADDKNRVRAYADGTLTEPSVPPKPVGFMIKTDNVHTRQTMHGEVSEPKYLCFCGKKLLGEWSAARCVTEITARQ